MKPQHTTHQTEQAERPFGPPVGRISARDASIRIIRGPHAGEAIPFDREILLVGRGDWCDIALPKDRQVSKQHCELQLTADGVQLRDLGSRNGICLGNVRIFDALWTPDVELQVGESTLRLELRGERRDIEVKFADESALLVGKSPKMRKLFSIMARLGRSELPILLLGETGTGKTTVARAIHDQSQRKDGPFVEVNCGALSASLIESLLFGHEKGAFTGAERSHRGYFEQAHGGTLFLDEIGELPIALQPKLLSVLERGRIQRLGSETERPVDFRLICSTHKDLTQEVQENRFRQDLYYRLAVVELELPPLRERLEDIPLLVDWLLRHNQPPSEHVFSPDAVKALKTHLWPGNVRELSNVVLRTLALFDVDDPDQDGAKRLYIEASDLPLFPSLSLGHGKRSEENTHETDPGGAQIDVAAFASLKELMEETERRAILHALAHCDGAVPEAARLLQITRPWLYKRIKKFGIER